MEKQNEGKERNRDRGDVRWSKKGETGAKAVETGMNKEGGVSHRHTEMLMKYITVVDNTEWMTHASKTI